MKERVLFVTTPGGWVQFVDGATVEVTRRMNEFDGILHVVRGGETVAEFKASGWYGYLYVDVDDEEPLVKKLPSSIKPTVQ